jgi:hypothetical protein
LAWDTSGDNETIDSATDLAAGQQTLTGSALTQAHQAGEKVHQIVVDCLAKG